MTADRGVTAADLADAFDRAPVGMAITSRGSSVVHANPAVCAMLGYDLSDLVGKTMIDLTHPDDLPASVAEVEKLRRGEIDRFSLVKRYVHRDGSIVWARVHVARVGDLETYHHLVHISDITREKLAEDALRESEERFRQMAQAIDQDFWFMSLEPLRLLYSSPAAAKIWGFDPMRNAERPGRIIEAVHPEDRDAFGALFASLLSSARAREYRIVRPDGELRWLRTRVFPVHDADGMVRRVAGVTEDITEQKQAQQEVARHRAFERLITTLSTEFVNLGEEGLEEGFRTALGEIASLVGADRAAIFLLHGDDRTLRRAYDWPDSKGASAVQETSFGIEHPLRRVLRERGVIRIESVADMPDEMADVRERLRRDGIGAIFDVPLVARGKLLGLLAMGTLGGPCTWPADLGAQLRIAAEMFAGAIERMRADEATRRHRDELAHVLRVGTMGQLAAGLAHELNQPLSAIVSYAQGCRRLLAAGARETAALGDALEKIADQAVRAGEVIRTLRSLVRKTEATREWHDVNHLVHEALRFIEPELADAGVQLDVEQARALPRVQVDAIQIEQVVLNLVRNAFEATMEREAGGGARAVRVRTSMSNARTVEVSVTDNGPGIARDSANRVFDDFYTTKAEGLGLGLSISQTIVEAHGGRLWADGGDAPGATFRFTLPAPAPE